MEARIVHPIKELPVSGPKSIATSKPLGDAHDEKTAKREYKILKNCGDCEPGGFGSTYGYGPR
jgi:hypothetical protein